MLIAVLGALLALLVSLPFWLPAMVVRLRLRIFAHVNGKEGIQVEVARFRALYENPAATGRSRGAVLSDLFWYWLAPGPQVHQEHLEAGERYTEVARTTRRILAGAHLNAPRIAAECTERVLGAFSGPVTEVRLRDVMMPIWADFYYEVVFGERCPSDARELIVGNADDVVTALKCCGLRHMARRERLTRYLVKRIEAGEVPHRLPDVLSTQEQAWYLQGTFFNTAVVQSSEAMTHLLMAIAQHADVQEGLRDGTVDLDDVMDEALRLYPLFGVAHRITTGEIGAIPAGSVLLFNYADFHQAGFDHPERFDPSRWKTASAKDANHVPYGVTANRACPARGLMPVTMRVVARETLERFELRTSAAHTRSIPNRGPCLLTDRSAGHRPVGGRLAVMRLRDRWEDVTRSLTQLVLGSYMVWDARRQRLCGRYFEQQDGSLAVD
ncbi:cytochrome P450 [Kibdelosporangium persicum]|uniref:Non-ribosomal peptide synthetase n=1 Tax=Kibdelosporangium persicum TaxID=2698649 RepID=A0ABX2EZA6_9PSEU|nr:cytochrome P450 [Kibdelosporangium persicum]NRN64386.1 Non-ribosomal peptide synthetase [Kibdelosporangium persicum]